MFTHHLKCAFVCGTIGFLLAISGIPVYGSNTATPYIENTIAFITTANLRLRSAPTTESESIRTVQKGQAVQVTDTRDGEWFAVSHNGTNGYMLAEFLLATDPAHIDEPQGMPVIPESDLSPDLPVINEADAEGTEKTEAVTVFKTAANLRLRTSPTTESSIIKTVSHGRLVTVADTRDGEWFAVSYNGASGYMLAEFLFEADGMQVAQAVGSIEMPEWHAIKDTAIRTGMPLQITDVRTGIVYRVSSFSNGSHADVEPITQEDTAAMLRAFGGSWSWTPRPVWVTVGGRTFAASISGMPHGGGINPNNGMNGQICLHFLGSRTHNGNRSHENDHQNAVREAFRAASS